jgi:hypothetical protein
MSWRATWRRSKVLSARAQTDLETWVRLRFQLAASDPMIAIIGACGRLTDAGMTTDEAMDTVLRILHEKITEGAAPRASSATGSSPQKASPPPIDGL